MVQTPGDIRLAHASHRQVVFMPWACMHPQDRVSWGTIVLAPWESVAKSASDQPVRSHVSSLMRMYRSSASSEWGGVQRGIGILTVGDQAFVPLSARQSEAIEEFRTLLFLCALSSGIHHVGPNAGHALSTAENFSLVYQNFEVGRDSLSERTGAILTLTSIGYRIGSTKFVKPGNVPSPMRFEYDEALLTSLKRLNRGDARLLRRIIRAAAAFCESYHNTPALDVNARVLLQASAFEILLVLPEQAPRNEYKSRVEAFRARPAERGSRTSSRSGGRSTASRAPSLDCGRIASISCGTESCMALRWRAVTTFFVEYSTKCWWRLRYSSRAPKRSSMKRTSRALDAPLTPIASTGEEQSAITMRRALDFARELIGHRGWDTSSVEGRNLARTSW